MNSTPLLAGAHLRTYNSIFQHPVSHNLKWQDVHTLFRHLGSIEVEPNGNLKVTRNGQVLVLHPTTAKDVSETDEIMGLRHFLERSEAVQPETNGTATHWLVVIDHSEARIFSSEMHGSNPRQIVPLKAENYFRHARNSIEVSRSRGKQDPGSFFELVAGALKAAGRILVFGTGTGMSSEMDLFIAWLQDHHPEVAGRIIGSLVVDEHHLTDDQLLAKAREFYANARAA